MTRKNNKRTLASFKSAAPVRARLDGDRVPPDRRDLPQANPTRPETWSTGSSTRRFCPRPFPHAGTIWSPATTTAYWPSTSKRRPVTRGRYLRVAHRYRLINELQSGIDAVDENPLTGQQPREFEMISRMPVNSMESGEKFLIVGGVGLIVGVDWDTIVDGGFGENSDIEPLSISWNINVPSPK